MISKFRLDIMEDTSVDLLNGLNEDKRLKMDLVTTVVCVCGCVCGTAGLPCVLWLLILHRCEPVPAQVSNQPDSGQVRLLQPAIDHTHSTPPTPEREGGGGDGYPAEANSPRKIQTNI